MAKEEVKMIGELSQSEIDKLKKEHKDVYALTAESPEDKSIHVGYFKKPDMDIMGAAATHAQTDPMKSGRILFNSCWLAGSEVVKSDNGEIKFSFIAKMNELFKIKEVEVKKL